MLLPGSGQWYAGRSRKASWMLAIAALIVAVWVWLWSRGEVFLLKLSVQPRWILALLAAAVAVGIFRIVVVVDAFRSVDAYRPRSRWATLGAVAGLGVLLVATLLPHVVVARYAVLQHDLITSVFCTRSAGSRPAAGVHNHFDDNTGDCRRQDVNDARSTGSDHRDNCAPGDGFTTVGGRGAAQRALHGR